MTSSMKGESPAAAIRRASVDSFIPVASLPGTDITNRKAASRAVVDGEVIKVARGLYYKGRRTTYGMTRPSTERIVAAALGGRGHGPAGHSAAAMWGVTTQVSPSMRVATLKHTNALNDVALVHRSNLARVDLSTREIALLELLRDPNAYVESGWDSFVDAVRSAAGEGLVDLKRVAVAARTEHDRATRDNLERLLSSLASMKEFAA